MDFRIQNKNYSVLALYAALVALIATVLLLIVRALVAMQVATVASVENLNQYVLISLSVVIISLAVYAILEPDRVRQLLTGRQARYGSNAIVLSIAFLAILGLLNYMVAKPEYGLNRKKDVTENQANTLAPETLAALQALPATVTATAFFSQDSDPGAASQLLDKIRDNSNGKFEYKFINPDLNPQAAMNAGITGDGKILMQMGEQNTIVPIASEDELLNGLLRLLNPESSTVYFLGGHGEKDIQQSGETSMTRAVSTLESKNYAVQTLNLLVDNKIPEDASVVVIAGPMKPLSPEEVKLLKGFLDQGGSLVVMEDPTTLTQFGQEADPLADLLAKEWGIFFDNDIVIDLSSAQPTIAASTFYDATHPITVNMNNLGSFYPFARSLRVGETAQGTTLSQLVRTNERSWGETDFASLSEGGQVGRDEDETLGPLTLAVAGENPATKGRVVVFGTSEFATDQLFDRLGNGDMFVNSVDWAAQKENLVNITPKNTVQRTFTPPSQLYGIVILLTAIFIIPGLVVLGGVSTWLGRRRQG